jgi:uncharacterized protein YdaU (DUF1376 family)
MAEKPDTWMPLYPGDYLKDTQHLTLVEHGSYMHLILAAWQAGGSLPIDDERLRTISKMDKKQWRKSSEILLDFFYEIDGKIRHKKIDKELKKAVNNLTQKKTAGKASAEAKKALKSAEKAKSQNLDDQRPLNSRCEAADQAAATEEATAGQRQINPSPSPSPSPVKEENRIDSLFAGNALDQPQAAGAPSAPRINISAEFDVFWRAYPGRLKGDGKLHKDGKQQARARFIEARKKSSLAAILDAVTAYAKATDARYVKDAHRWLANANWNDEEAAAPPSAMPKSRMQTQHDEMMRTLFPEKFTDDQSFTGQTIDGAAEDNHPNHQRSLLDHDED